MLFSLPCTTPLEKPLVAQASAHQGQGRQPCHADLMLKMKPSSSPAIGLLARETALLVAESSFQPQIRALHISGLANAAADALSRRAAPHDKSSVVWELLACLASVPKTTSPARPRGWYRTLSVNEENGVPHKRSVLPYFVPCMAVIPCVCEVTP